MMTTTTRHATAFLIVLALLPALVGAVGCAKVIPPAFEAAGVQEVERADDRSVIVFTVRATNPNAEPIPLHQVNYRVLIDGEPVFEGIRSPETTLHRYASSEFTLPAVVPQEKLTGLIEYALQGSVRYIPPGRLSEVLFDADLVVPEVVLDISGTINAQGE